jgi:hypothetical protein
MALVGALIGLPSFVEIGLVLPMPVIFLVSRRSGLFVLLPAWSSERSSSEGVPRVRGCGTPRAFPSPRAGSTMTDARRSSRHPHVRRHEHRGVGEFPIPQIGAELDSMPLISDPVTGMQVMKLIYRAGFTNPWRHPPVCARDLRARGTLTTHQGRVPAGSFIWFPEGGTMHRNASADGDCTILFITNKPFDIHLRGRSVADVASVGICCARPRPPCRGRSSAPCS